MLGSYGEVYVFPRDAFEKAMTAIAVVNTKDGFLIAADGRVRLDDETKRIASAEILAQVGDNEQKIFLAAFPDQALAYAVTGTVRDSCGFDLLKAIESQIGGISQRKFDDLRSCLKTLGGKINKAINEARKDGSFEKFPQIKKMERSHGWVIASLFFCGYFDHFPCFSRLDFFHFGGDAQFQVNEQPLRAQLVMGSDIVARHMYGEPRDPQFTDFIKSINYDSSLEDAKQFARGYIEACSSALGIEMDEPICKGIGGHIHMATITEVGGFEWAVSPIRGI